jgi:hypothetical protein
MTCEDTENARRTRAAAEAAGACLLDANADSQRVDRAFKQDTLAVVAANNDGRQQELLGLPVF